MVKDSSVHMHVLVATRYGQREVTGFSSSAHNQGPYLHYFLCAKLTWYTVYLPLELKSNSPFKKLIGCTYLGVLYIYRDIVVSADCTQQCTCGRTGELSDCAPLPGCPPNGCLTTEQHESYQQDFAGCPTPCDICGAGRLS